uniref:Uncharacterized protein n=1 Tax=uncultured Armatimonadetes bacterium TaxID=157466 RepID=A0A6J4K3D9_9BACT|nr:hypothetical protein AVDCRST_MAG63-4642 [uncultured Armatimonadetes bacterium]
MRGRNFLPLSSLAPRPFLSAEKAGRLFRAQRRGLSRRVGAGHTAEKAGGANRPGNNTGVKAL